MDNREYLPTFQELLNGTIPYHLRQNPMYKEMRQKALDAFQKREIEHKVKITITPQAEIKSYKPLFTGKGRSWLCADYFYGQMDYYGAKKIYRQTLWNPTDDCEEVASILAIFTEPIDENLCISSHYQRIIADFKESLCGENGHTFNHDFLHAYPHERNWEDLEVALELTRWSAWNTLRDREKKIALVEKFFSQTEKSE